MSLVFLFRNVCCYFLNHRTNYNRACEHTSTNELKQNKKRPTIKTIATITGEQINMILARVLSKIEKNLGPKLGCRDGISDG